MTTWNNRHLSARVYAADKVLDLTGYRYEFSVEQTRRKDPNTALLEIYNLGVGNRGLIAGDHNGIEIIGGYDNPGLLFRGVTTSVVSDDRRPDRVTIIKAVDGGKYYTTTWFSGSWDAGVPIDTILQEVASTLQYPVKITATGRLQAPRVAHGRPKDVLTQLCQDFNLHWQIQNEVVEIVSEDSSFDGTTVPLVELSSTTGMVGSPSIEELEKKHGKRRFGVLARSLLNPQLRVNGYIRISGSLVGGSTERTLKGQVYQRPGANGLFRLSRVSHFGGLHLRDFYTDVEGEYLA